MSYATEWTASQDATVIQKVAIAVTHAALNVQAEATTAPNHAARAEFANAVLNNSDAYKNRFALAAATQGVTSASTDAAIQAAIDSVWNAFAGPVT